MTTLNSLFTSSAILFTTLVLVCSQPAIMTAASVPKQVGGITLGSNISDYDDIEYSDYLKEVVVTDWHGFRKGIISYGVCSSPGTIVKIRMKYEDSSKKFYNKLLKTFKKRFGKPQIWKGDSFGVLHIWKWTFTDDQGRIVNLILQHNLQNTNENIGNMVKLSLPQLEEKERLCFIQQCEEIVDDAQKERKEQLKKTSWDFLIPQ